MATQVYRTRRNVKLDYRVNQKFQIHLSASKLFEAPTVEKLALAIEKIIVEELEEITEEEAHKFVLERSWG